MRQIRGAVAGRSHVAGVPGLEPRLTEPESVGLPITPYPKAADPRGAGAGRECIARRRRPSQTDAASADRAPPRSRAERAVAAEQLDRLEQRRRDPAPGDRDPHRPERDLGLEPEPVDERRAQRRLDRRRGPNGSSAVERVDARACSAGRASAVSTALAVLGVDREPLLVDEQEARACSAPASSVSMRSCTSGTAASMTRLLLGASACRRSTPAAPR